MTKHKAPKKKQYFMKTTSKRTGAIILIATISIVAFMICFYFYASDFADKQRQYEDQWRLMSCEEMLNDNENDPYVWKVVSLKDKKCITDKEFENMINHFTR